MRTIKANIYEWFITADWLHNRIGAIQNIVMWKKEIKHNKSNRYVLKQVYKEERTRYIKTLITGKLYNN